MTRRGRGDGSLYFDKARGRWTGVLSVGDDPAEGKRRRRKVSAPAKTEAARLLDELRAELRRAGAVGRRDVTVAQVVRGYLGAPPPQWRSPSTMAVNQYNGERIIAGLGRVRLASLTAADVERFLHALAAPRKGRPLSASTISQTRALLARALRRAERDGLTGRNAAALAVLPRAATRKSRALTVDQAAALLALDMTPWWRAWVVTGITMGLRPGELLGLRWEDVDFDAGVLRVRRSLHADASGKYLDELKTESSKRTLALTGGAAGSLRALRTAQAQARLRRRGGYADMGLVFARQDGLPQWPAEARRGFKRLCARAGIGDWHPHELRHSFVSIASAAGVPIEDIADAAGHLNANVTRAVYRHVISDKITRTSAAMDEIFGAESGK